MTPPAPAPAPLFSRGPRTLLSLILMLIASFMGLLLTLSEAGVSGLPSWLLGGTLTAAWCAFLAAWL